MSTAHIIILFLSKTGCPLSSYRITATSSKVRNTSAFLQQFRYTVVHQVLMYIGTIVLSSVVHQVLSFVVHKVLRYRDVTGTVYSGTKGT